MNRRWIVLGCWLWIVGCRAGEDPPVDDDPSVERSYRADPAAHARELLLRSLGDAASGVELRELAMVPRGMVRARFAVKVGGLVVDGGDAVVVLRGDGTLRELSAPRVAPLAAAARIGAAEAERAALAARGAALDVEPASTLVALPLEGGAVVAAWRVVVRGEGLRRELFVDAASGEVIHEREGLHAASVKGSGLGVRGERRALDVTRRGEGYELRDDERGVRTSSARGTWRVPGTLVRSDALDAWDEEVFGAGAAVDAHANGALVVDYLERVLGRHSWDDDGGTLRLVVHVGPRLANAYWDGRHAVFGDGDGVATLALSGALDVVAHEIFHGVTESEVGLVYERQSGALAESLSDLFGSFVEQDAGAGDWVLGAAIAEPPIRDLARPWVTDGPAHMRDYRELPSTPDGDMGGVHVNSSIPSYAAVLLADGGRHATSQLAVSRIGRDAVRDVWWRAITVYLTPRAGFGDFARATVLAAEDLFGEDSAQVAEVRHAWRAVGVVPR